MCIFANHFWTFRSDGWWWQWRLCWWWKWLYGGGGDGGCCCCHGAQPHYGAHCVLFVTYPHIAHKFAKYFISCDGTFCVAFFFIGWILILIYYVWHFLFAIYSCTSTNTDTCSDDMVHIFCDDTFSSAVLLNWICRDARRQGGSERVMQKCKRNHIVHRYRHAKHARTLFFGLKQSKNTFFSSVGHFECDWKGIFVEQKGSCEFLCAKVGKKTGRDDNAHKHTAHKSSSEYSDGMNVYARV